MRLKSFFFQLFSENQLETVFYGVESPTEEWFVEVALRLKHGWNCHYKGRLAGAVWLTNIEGAGARIHFAVFRAGKWAMIRGADVVLKWLFQRYAVLWAFLPEANAKAIPFLISQKFRVIGVIPELAFIAREKKNCGMIVAYRRRADEEVYGRPEAGPQRF